MIEEIGTNISIKCIFSDNRSLDFNKKIISSLYFYFKDMTIEELNALFIDKIVVTDQFIIKNEKSISFISEYDTLLKVDGMEVLNSDKEKPFMIRLIEFLEFISNKQSIDTDESLVIINNSAINIKFSSWATVAIAKNKTKSSSKYFKYTVEADLFRLNNLKDIVYDYYNYKEEKK